MINKILLLITLLFPISAKGTETITLTKDNHVYIDSEITDELVSKISKQLVILSSKRKDESIPLYIVLNSPGGSVFAGESFIQFVKHIKNIHTISIFAASMAHAIVQGLPGKRYGTEHSLLMAHRAKGNFSGQFETGEVESLLQVLKNYVKRLEQRAANRIGISLEKYKQKIIGEWWSTSEESIEENILDEIVEVKCSKYLMETVYKDKIETIFGTMEVIKSLCPMMP